MKKLIFSSFALALGASASSAADLGVPRSPVATAVVAPSFNWTGFYLGADVGFIANRYRAIDTLFPLNPSNPNPNGPKLGVHAGYRHQFANNVVIGLEGDLSYISATRESALVGFPAVSIRGRVTMDGSVRGSLGFAVDRALVYATGGVAFLNIAGCTVAGPAACTPNTNFSGTRTGWTGGAGVAYAFNNNWSLRAEYLYANYGARNYVMPAYTARVTNETHTFRLGVSYLFATGPSAVVARY